MHIRQSFYLVQIVSIIGASTGTTTSATGVKRNIQESPAIGCPVCPGGGQITNPVGEVAIGNNDIRTCAELEEDSADITDVDCQFIQSIADVVCECSEPLFDDNGGDSSIISTPTPPTRVPARLPTVNSIGDGDVVDDASIPEEDDGMVTLFIKIIAETPQNIGWEVTDLAGVELRIAAPFGAYSSTEQEITDKLTVTEGVTYKFVMKSKFGDDLGQDGLYELSLGEDGSGPVLVQGTGDFGEEITYEFTPIEEGEEDDDLPGLGPSPAPSPLAFLPRPTSDSEDSDSTPEPTSGDGTREIFTGSDSAAISTRTSFGTIWLVVVSTTTFFWWLA